MSDVRGLPLLSGPPPNYEQTDACRRCNKEFNIILTRSRKCNHCGYHYCHSCTDFQALMPRTNEEGATGYSAMSVCAYCIEHLNVTASGKGQLKTMPLAKLKKYIEVYSIKAPRAVEKEDLVEAILAARGPNGCLPPQNEMYYRRNSVPNRFAGARPRGIFSRVTQEPQPPPRQPPPPTNRQTYPEFARPDLAPDDPPQQHQQQYAPPPHPPPPPQPQYNSYRPSYQPPPHPPPGHGYPPPPPPPNHFARPTPPPPVPPPHNYYTPPPPPPGMNYQPRYHPPPVPPRPQAQAPFQQPHAHTFPRSEPPTPPQASRPQTRSASAQPQAPEDPRPRATSTAPPPSLDELLDMTTPAISSLSIGQLKAILFKNHVNVGVVLEKSDLVTKVRKLLDDERKERQAQRAREEAEEAERIERQRRILEEAQKEKKEKERRERMERGEVVSDDEDDDGEGRKEEKEGDDNEETKEEKAGPSTPPKAKGTAADLERTGLCVICQDEEANIAIVDCGHLAMCRGCSDLIMNSSRECPLCRTRIVTEARLLRIFKS